MNSAEMLSYVKVCEGKCEYYEGCKNSIVDGYCEKDEYKCSDICRLMDRIDSMITLIRKLEHDRNIWITDEKAEELIDMLKDYKERIGE